MTAARRAPSGRERGLIETLASGSLRVKVYAGIDPLSGRRHYLTETIPAVPRALAEAKRYARASSGRSTSSATRAPAPRSISSWTADLLRSHRRRCEDDANSLGVRISESGRLFSASPDHSAWLLPSSVTQRYARMCARLGSDRNIHELRHYSATELISAGVDVRTVAGRLGMAEAARPLCAHTRHGCRRPTSEPPEPSPATCPRCRSTSTTSTASLPVPPWMPYSPGTRISASQRIYVPRSTVARSVPVISSAPSRNSVPATVSLPAPRTGLSPNSARADWSPSAEGVAPPWPEGLLLACTESTSIAPGRDLASPSAEH